MKSVSVRLQDGIVVIATDPSTAVLPSALWDEILRVGFIPSRMDVWATAKVDGSTVAFDGLRWPLLEPRPVDAVARPIHLRTLTGADDPPHVELVE